MILLRRAAGKKKFFMGVHEDCTPDLAATVKEHCAFTWAISAKSVTLDGNEQEPSPVRYVNPTYTSK
jgi:hypothetical protein